MTTTLYSIAFASALALSAVWLVYGIIVGARGVGLPRGGPGGIRQIIALTRSLRLVLSGLCLAGFAFGLAWDHSALTAMSAVIGLEELYECTMALFFLRRIERTEAAHYTGSEPVVGGPHLALSAHPS